MKKFIHYDCNKIMHFWLLTKKKKKPSRVITLDDFIQPCQSCSMKFSETGPLVIEKYNKDKKKAKGQQTHSVTPLYPWTKWWGDITNNKSGKLSQDTPVLPQVVKLGHAPDKIQVWKTTKGTNSKIKQARVMIPVHCTSPLWDLSTHEIS